MYFNQVLPKSRLYSLQKLLYNLFCFLITRFSVSNICSGLALCGALSIYTDKETVAMLRPTCLINCTAELPDTPLPDTVHTYLKVPVTDNELTDLRPHMDIIADIIHRVRMLYVNTYVSNKTLLYCDKKNIN